MSPPSSLEQQMLAGKRPVLRSKLACKQPTTLVVSQSKVAYPGKPSVSRRQSSYSTLADKGVRHPTFREQYLRVMNFSCQKDLSKVEDHVGHLEDLKRRREGRARREGALANKRKDSQSKTTLPQSLANK